MSLSHFRYRFAIRVKRRYSYKWCLSCWIIRDLYSLLTDAPTTHVQLPVDQPIFPHMDCSDSHYGSDWDSEDEIVMGDQNTIISVSSAADLRMKHRQTGTQVKDVTEHNRTESTLSQQSGNSLVSVYSSHEENSDIPTRQTGTGNPSVSQPVLYPFVMPYSMPVFPMPQPEPVLECDSGDGTQAGYPMMINQMPVIPIYPQGTDMNANYLPYMNQMGLVYYPSVQMNSMGNEQNNVSDQGTKKQYV